MKKNNYIKSYLCVWSQVSNDPNFDIAHIENVGGCQVRLYKAGLLREIQIAADIADRHVPDVLGQAGWPIVELVVSQGLE